MKLFIFTILLFLSFLTKSQTIEISGKVTNENLQPLIDVHVTTLDSSFSVVTDLGGVYTINISDTISTLYFNKNGYKTTSINIKKIKDFNVIMSINAMYEIPFEELLQMKVLSVSLREQKISEAPGVVTIISQDDIKALGFRTVREALTYVAGFSPFQNDDEQILSVRGIFATTNQKILVMRDGHALNEANLDIPQTEYSISIETIKQIEVIRGPGASIYGNSALAAVVNIVSIDNLASRAKVSFGNYGQMQFDGYSGTTIKEKGYINTYGRYTDIQGQSYNVKVPSTNLNGTYKTFNYPQNFDIGFKYKYQDITTSLSVRRHCYQTYWSAQGKYTNVDSLFIKPRLLQNTINYDFYYEPQITKNLKLHFRHFIDFGQLNNYRLLSTIDTVKYTHGRVQLNEWNTSKLSFNYYASYNLSSKGEMLLGISAERREYMGSWLASNTDDSSKIIFSKKTFFPTSTETREAIFSQAQYTFTKWLKVDAGARFDMAQNFKSSFNPRLALIFYPIKKVSVKTIYTRAFQAPGYSYRTSNADYSGSIDKLEPERLTTINGAIRYELKNNSFIEVASFYNRLNNLITRTDKNYYANFGKLASYGIEVEGRLNNPYFSLFGNYSLVLPDTTHTDKNFISKNIENNRFKHFSTHLVNGGIIVHALKNVSFSVSGQYGSSFYTVESIKVQKRFTVNSTLTLLNICKKMEVSFSAYNLFNVQYKLGDPSVLPMEQPGRWLMMSIAYNGI